WNRRRFAPRLSAKFVGSTKEVLYSRRRRKLLYEDQTASVRPFARGHVFHRRHGIRAKARISANAADGMEQLEPFPDQHRRRHDSRAGRGAGQERNERSGLSIRRD